MPAQTQSLLGKKVSDLISDDTRVLADGSVVGTLKHIDSYSQFDSKNKPSGNFFPMILGEQYQGEEITATGPKTKNKKVVDREWILHVEGSDSTFKFECKGKTIVTLNFKLATLEAE